ncbi:ABC-type sulfate transport system substrate-binding protein [Caldalkalibacillus uzonensis]|uniref:ABC-type sulfate transport system substrate-binding protein n=1 Tax=Caldalkalibacillus uzonensis TaxID=353224 RepID=A0ABU0CW13_9BACI|nr:sigma factor G inhibitor Gin [Caldalkalibacillus uzonensis]MDQ0340615.1 ABC-type sulfate transport system substrate-binding protein [Caldalkalibacillus uzonensis]
MNKHICVICANPKTEGITIWHHFICRQCEAEIVSCDVTDEKYPFFIRQMRKIWMKEHA